jgi:hypothetical protein
MERNRDERYAHCPHFPFLLIRDMAAQTLDAKEKRDGQILKISSRFALPTVLCLPLRFTTGTHAAFGIYTSEDAYALHRFSNCMMSVAVFAIVCRTFLPPLILFQTPLISSFFAISFAHCQLLVSS